MINSDIASREAAEDAELAAVREQSTTENWLQSGIKKTAASLEGAATLGQSNPDAPHPVTMWLAKLPQNVGVGMIDAAVNTADAVKSFEGAWLKSQKMPGFTADEAKAKQQPAPTGTPAPPMPNPIYDGAKQAVLGFRDYLAQGSDTPDKITQAISQYTIPFLGFSKLIGGLHGATTLGTIGRTAAAESLTAGTVLAPHDPRAADLLQLGKHVEGKFGDAMNTIAPDGSLLNHYINYMTDRSNESDAEGRFKNVVDNLALTAAASSMLKATAMTLKGGFNTAKYALENFGTGPAAGSKGAQSGLIDMFGNRVVDPPVSYTVGGDHRTFQSPNGGLIVKEDPNALRVTYIHVKEDARGQGEAQAMMRSAFDKAQAEGKTLQSDFHVSTLQERVYDKLEKEGYTVVRNPSHLDTATGYRVTDKAGVPVFEITAPPPAKPERRQEINKAMRANAEKAPANGAGIVQTGKDHYTLFLNRKPQGSYGSAEAAQKELDALNESIFTGKDNGPPPASPAPPKEPIGVIQQRSIDEAAAAFAAKKQGKK